MSNPLFWLGVSLLLVAAGVVALLVAAIPALQELARAARSAEKFFDTLSKELPPTLDAIRMTSLEITDLKDDVSEGVQNAGQIVRKVDESLDTAKKQAKNVEIGTRSLFVGVKAAWKSLTGSSNKRNIERLPSSPKSALDLREWEISPRKNPNPESDYNHVGNYPKPDEEDWSDHHGH